MTSATFLPERVLTHEGWPKAHLHDHLHGKTLGILFADVTDPSFVTSSFKHISNFYNRVNWLDPATKKATRAGVQGFEIVLVPTAGTHTELIEFMARPDTPPMLMLAVDDEFIEQLVTDERYAGALSSGILPALVVVNWDGSLISGTGLPDIVQKGDACLSSWQMVRKPEVGGGDGQVEAGEAYVAGSKTKVGGVTLDLPF